MSEKGFRLCVCVILLNDVCCKSQQLRIGCRFTLSFRFCWKIIADFYQTYNLYKISIFIWPIFSLFSFEYFQKYQKSSKKKW